MVHPPAIANNFAHQCRHATSAAGLMGLTANVVTIATVQIIHNRTSNDSLHIDNPSGCCCDRD
jgi:hypothetical protein